jgi:hypothetical protein
VGGDRGEDVRVGSEPRRSRRGTRLGSISEATVLNAIHAELACRPPTSLCVRTEYLWGASLLAAEPLSMVCHVLLDRLCGQTCHVFDLIAATVVPVGAVQPGHGGDVLLDVGRNGHRFQDL